MANGGKAQNPNIMIILNDDMGFSDIGCYGGEIETPNLDRLAANGLRYSQFYNTARCSPSRASLLTGLHPHQTGVGILTYNNGPEGYAGNLNKSCVTVAEVLKAKNYKTYLSGKWHVSSNLTEPTDSWPLQRGFDYFFGTIIGAGSFYNPNTLTRGNDNIEHEAENDPSFFYTDAISDQAAAYVRQHSRHNPDTPFFQYVAYTAPHWPLHAHDEDIARYKGRFDAGWDTLRERRLQKLVEDGIIHPNWKLTERDPTQPPWTEAEHREWTLRCMEVYAAQIDRMDQGIGRILAALEETGQLDNTLIIFLSDNGACAEDIPDGVTARELVDQLMIAKAKTRTGKPVRLGNDPTLMPGGEDTYQSYGTAWANLSNSPFRLYKHWIHEGGIATPFIVHWPRGIQEKGGLRHNPSQLTPPKRWCPCAGIPPAGRRGAQHAQRAQSAVGRGDRCVHRPGEGRQRRADQPAAGGIHRPGVSGQRRAPFGPRCAGVPVGPRHSRRGGSRRRRGTRRIDRRRPRRLPGQGGRGPRRRVFGVQ